MERNQRETERLLDDAIRQLRELPIPACPQALPDANELSEESERTFVTSWRRRIVRHPFRFTAALAMVGAFLLAVALNSPFHRADAMAFGEVQKAVATTETVQFHILSYWDDKEPLVSTVLNLGTDRSRLEGAFGTTSITDRKQKRSLAIHHPQRLAILHPLPDDSAKMSSEWHRIIRSVPEHAKRVGERELDGRPVVDFLLRREEREYRVTVDAATKLPIRMEVDHGRNAVTGVHCREVYTGFQFDVPLDESLFELKPPDGYAFENHIPRAPSGDPPDDSELVISPETGIGPVKLGAPRDEIVRAFGEPEWEATRGVPGPSAPWGPRAGVMSMTTMAYPSRGFELHLAAERLQTIGATSKEWGDGSAGFRGRTNKGIRLRDSWEKVQDVYGKPVYKQEGFFLDYSTQGLSFQFRDGRLVGITIHPPGPEVHVEDLGGGRFKITPK